MRSAVSLPSPCAPPPLLWAPVDAWAQSGRGQFGTVRFPTSCQVAVQPAFERAVAILHSFFYPESVKAFEAVIAADPDCAMAYWGWRSASGPTRSCRRGPPRASSAGSTPSRRARRWPRPSGSATGSPRWSRRTSATDSVPTEDAERALRAGDGAAGRQVSRRQGSGDLLRARPAGGGRSRRQDLRAAASRRARSWSRSSGRSPDHPAWPTTSSTRTTSSRWPRAAWLPPTEVRLGRASRPRTPAAHAVAHLLHSRPLGRFDPLQPDAR